jgi:hypothetical protein
MLGGHRSLAGLLMKPEPLLVGLLASLAVGPLAALLALGCGDPDVACPTVLVGEYRAFVVGTTVQLRVRVAFREQPDGTVRRTYTILQVSSVDD